MRAAPSHLGDLPPLARRELRPWQSDCARAILLSLCAACIYAIRGGLGSGKSALLCIIADAICMMRPGCTVVLGMDTWERLRKVHLPLMMQLRPKATWNATAKTWTYANGSMLYMVHLKTPAGAVQGTTAVEGLNVHVFIIDECQALMAAILDVARSRARISAVDLMGVEHPPAVIMCGIPVEPAWWVGRAREVGGMVWLPATAENIAALGPGYIDGMRAVLSDRAFQGLVLNEPLPPEGRIFYAFKPERNVLRDPAWKPDPANRRVAIVADLGINNPCALVAVEDVERGAWVIVADWEPDDMSTIDFARHLAAKGCAPRDHGSPAWPLDIVTGDRVGDGRDRQTGVKDFAIFAQAPPDGIGRRPVVSQDPVRRSVAAGIERVNLALERGRILIWGKVYDEGITAPPKQRTLARAMTGYRYREGTTEPLKDDVNDHAADCLRYLVAAPGTNLWSVSPVDGRLAPSPRPEPSQSRSAKARGRPLKPWKAGAM